MEKQGWKTTAIICMVILGLLIALMTFGVSIVNDEENKTYECSLECEKNSDCFFGSYDVDTHTCSFITYNDLQYMIDNR